MSNMPRTRYIAVAISSEGHLLGIASADDFNTIAGRRNSLRRDHPDATTCFVQVLP